MRFSRGLVCDALGVGCFAFVGVIIRYWLEVMSKFPGFPGFHDFYANLFGTMVLGFAASHKNFLTLSPPTAVGITTGLCGSITTFSSWQYDNAIVLTNWLEENSTWENILISITNQIVGVTACISIFLFGKHLAMKSPKNNDKVEPADEEPEHQLKIEFWIYLSLFIATTVISLAIGFGTDVERLSLAFSVFFAPIGAITRWIIGKLLNVPEKFGDYYLPYGTLAVNIIGCLLLAMINIVIQEHACFSDPNDSNHLLKSGIAHGFATGFCGCFTTVSTWISELHTLELKRAYIYGIFSIVLAQMCLIAAVGGYRWSQNEWEMCD
uniref:Fluoride ion transporter CrcB n=1 Tax=Paramoeba aestuarina TaxID=180227 RepID=A0A7S4L1J0_9EUKA|mmetsp:Transcript_29666/g.45835  ORF Transcript_29666/g.45835 Transcript_29666/m.45835 type:complete len:324 (-) Transcript_29666:94-1065(-)